MYGINPHKPSILFMGHSKQCRSRSDVSDQDLHSLLTESLTEIWGKNEKYHPTPLKLETDWSN